MVTKRKIIVIEDNRKEPVTPGYASSGESSFTRHAAQGHAVDTSTRDRSNMSLSRLGVMVAHERYVIERLERRAAEARANPDPRFAPGRSPTFLGICSRLQKTRVLLTRLETELRRAAT